VRVRVRGRGRGMRAVLSWIEEEVRVEGVGKVRDVGLCYRCTE